MSLSLLLTILFGCLVLVANAFYLPGVAPRDYRRGEQVEIKVNKLDSVVTQVPFDYYSLPFCQPGKIEEAAENLGEILSGDKIENSDYLV
jgi:transmembrane 9 superfamily protein 2/4